MMARFDLYERPGAPGYLLDLQSDLLGGLNTRVVAPLLPIAEAPRPAARLNPIFEIDGQRYVMLTQFMAAIPRAELQRRTGSLAHAHDAVMHAVEVAFTGV